MRKSYKRCLELITAGQIRRTAAFTYEDADTGDVWDELVYQLADDGRIVLGHDGAIHATGESAEQPSTRAVRRRREALAGPFQTASS